MELGNCTMASANATGDFMQEIFLNRPFGWIVRDPSQDYHFKFEEANPYFWHDFVKSRQNWALYAGVAYIITIYSLEHWMRNRPAFNLQFPLFLWNLGLGIFSVIGFARMLPGMLYILSKPNGFYNSICTKVDISVGMGFWALLFVFSKFIELGDTVFIVLRKRPLVFLQWYHHLVTMMATWILAPHMEPAQVCYIVLNYGVHSLMYPYFSLKAIGIDIPRRLANVITTLQLAQMIIGFAINTLSMYFYQTGQDCARHPSSIKVFAVVYGTFLFLFGKLFFDSVIKPNREKRRLEKKMH